MSERALRLSSLLLFLHLAAGHGAGGSAGARPATAGAAEPGRVVAVGDVHGDLHGLVGILKEASLLDGTLAWTGGDAGLVLTGDYLDRGPGGPDVLDFLMRLEEGSGGKVRILLGNHEILNLIGDLRYVAAGEFARFVTPRSDEARGERWEERLRFLAARAARMGLDPPAPPTDAERRAWEAEHPAGYFERREAFGPDGAYGRWLRDRDAAVVLDGVLYVHAGPGGGEFAAVADLNGRVRDEIAAFDRRWAELERAGVILPWMRWSEALRLVAEEAALWDAVDSLPPDRLDPAALEHRPDDAARAAMRDLLAHESWTILAPEGPLWTRVLARGSDEELRLSVVPALARLGAQRVVAGHTPAEDGRVQTRLDGTVFLIDTGLSSSVAGRASALEVQDGEFAALYAGAERVPLAAGATSPAYAAAAYDPLAGFDAAAAEAFLREGAIVEEREIGSGITRPWRATLEKAGRRHDAAVQSMDACEERAERPGGRRERSCDSWRYNVAAYEIAKALGIRAVPPTVERPFRGRDAAFTWWIDDATTLAKMKERRLAAPDGGAWNRQQWVVGVFDELIYNTDRNQGNLLVDPAWTVWMIDHSRAFRTKAGLRNPALLARMKLEPALLARLQAFDAERLRACCEAYLSGDERRAVLARRDSILARFGEAAPDE
jgi:hypothetical protein